MPFWVAVGLIVFPWVAALVGSDYPAVLALFEALCGFAGGACVLRGSHRTPSKLLAAALCSVGLGDLLCGIEFAHRGAAHVATRGVGEASYTLFWALVFAHLMLCSGWRAIRESRLLWVVFATAFAAVVYLQVEFVLPAQHPRGFELSLGYLTHTVWVVTKALGAAASLVCSLVALRLFEFCLSHALAAMAVASLSTAYHAAAADYSAFSLAEPIWACSLVAVLLTVVRVTPGAGVCSDASSPARSLRVGLGAAVFVANCVVLLVFVGLGATRVETAFQVSAIGFGLFASWLAANSVAFYTTTELSKTSSRLPMARSMDALATDGEVPPIVIPQTPARPLLHEFDRLAEDYRQLAVQANGLIAAMVKARSTESVARMASRVAHDIRSPLAALTVIMKDLESLPEDPRNLAKAAIERIHSIANGLLSESRTQEQQAPPQHAVLVHHVVEQIVREKHLSLRERPGLDVRYFPQNDSRNARAVVSSTELGRTLSNLLNNAAEAVETTGAVQIDMRRDGDEIRIDVSDTGVGIPPERLARLGTYGASFGKTGGSGIGLHAAQEFANGAGGSLEIHSVVGEGTRVTLCLPLAGSPEQAAL